MIEFSELDENEQNSIENIALGVNPVGWAHCNSDLHDPCLMADRWRMIRHATRIWAENNHPESKEALCKRIRILEADVAAAVNLNESYEKQKQYWCDSHSDAQILTNQLNELWQVLGSASQDEAMERLESTVTRNIAMKKELDYAHTTEDIALNALWVLLDVKDQTTAIKRLMQSLEQNKTLSTLSGRIERQQNCSTDLDFYDPNWKKISIFAQGKSSGRTEFANELINIVDK